MKLLRFVQPLFTYSLFSFLICNALNAMPQNVSELIITVESKIDICCATLGSQIDQLTNIVETNFAATFTAIAAISTGSCDFSGTYTELSALYNQDFTTQSKLDLCCHGILSKVDDIVISSSCDLSGTYTVLNALGLCNAIPLTIPPSGATILNEGVYCLTHDASTTGPGVSIFASNVVLNLNGHLIQSSGGAAIEVGTFSQCVTIHNGVIADTNLGINFASLCAAIHVFEIDFNGCANAISAQNGLQDSAFKRLNFLDCPSPLSLAGAIHGVIIEDCLCDSSGSFSINGDGTSTNDVSFNRCISSNCVSAFAIGGTKVLFDSCQAINIGNLHAFGIGPTCPRAIFRKCTALGVASTGYLIQSSATMENCIADSCVYGFDLSAGSKCVLKNCEASNNANAGFSISAANSVVKDSCATNNPIGFDLTNSFNCSIVNCDATDNLGTGFLGNGADFLHAVFYLNSATNNGTNYSNLGAISAPTVLLTSTGRLYGDNLANTLP